MAFGYKADAWFEDSAAMLEATYSVETKDFPKWVVNYFRSRYPDLQEADWKMERQRLAYAYLENHMHFFESRSLVIASTNSVAVAVPLRLALYRVFSAGTAEPSPEEIASMAQDFERQGY